MSIRRTTDNFASSDIRVLSRGDNTPNLDIPPNLWVRNPSWIARPAVLSTEQKMVGLHAVYDDAVNNTNFVNIRCWTSTGTYRVNWGDGTPDDVVASGTSAEHIYSYSATPLDNTNAPVTFQDATDTVTRTAHGYTNGTPVSFDSIVSTTGIVASARYYVINATTDTFQLSNTPTGSAIALTNDGSGFILPYKIAVVTVTPETVGANLTGVALHFAHSQTGLALPYISGWLDIAISGALTQTVETNRIGFIATATGNNARALNLERVDIIQSAMTNMSNLFNGLIKLNSVSVNTSATLTNTSGMFSGCTELYEPPLFNTASVTNMSSMFSSSGVVTVPLYNTSSVTNMNNMFLGATRLHQLPLFNTINVTDMSGMLSNTQRLRVIPLFDTRNVTTMSNMLSGSSNGNQAIEVPCFDTRNVTDMSSMFASSSIRKVPAFDMSKVTNTNLMFGNCPSLEEVGDFDLPLVTNASQMFLRARALAKVGRINMPLVTNTSAMFLECLSLKSIRSITTGTALTNISQMFSTCNQIVEIPEFNTVNVTSFLNAFNNLNVIKSLPNLNTGNVTWFEGAFNGCRSITTVPKYDYSKAQNLNGIFANCPNLESVPDMPDTGLVTDGRFMFENCSRLRRAPWINTSNMTTVQAMFSQCRQLEEVPLYDFSKVTNTTNLFWFCLSLQRVPLFNFAALTNANQMFQNCGKLKEIPAFNFTLVSSSSGFSGIFGGTSGSNDISPKLRRIRATGFRFTFSVANNHLNAAALDEIYTNLPTVTGQTITVTGNFGTTGDTPSIATAKGWTVTGS